MRPGTTIYCGMKQSFHVNVVDESATAGKKPAILAALQMFADARAHDVLR